MQVVRFGKKEDSNIIDIDDVAEDNKKIYCYKYDSGLRFLAKHGNLYYWESLNLISHGNGNGYNSFKDALNSCTDNCYELMIFNNQCEVLEYAKKM